MHASNRESAHPAQGFSAGTAVVDVANPDHHGKVIEAGPEVSEIRFDDGKLRNVPNHYLRSIDDAPPREELENPTLATELVEAPPEDSAVRDGQAAWHRLRSNSTWDDWKKVGAAHVIGRATAMRDGHVKNAKPKGRAYNAAFRAWQKQFGFEELDKGDRSRLIDCMDHVAEIESWLETLPVADRLRLNHPTSMWRRWKAATTEPNTKSKVSVIQKLQESIVSLEEENVRLKREIDQGGGDLWSPEDRVQDIARVMVAKLNRSKAEKVAREILKLAKEAAHG